MSGKTTKRTVKLTVRSLDDPFGDGWDEFFDESETEGDDAFSGFSYPIEDIEDAAIRKIEEDERSRPLDGVEIVSTAEFFSDGETVRIAYDESFDGLAADVRTEISFSASNPSVVAVMRTGRVNNTLVFEEGRTHTSVYDTGVVPLEVAVNTRKAENFVSAETGKGDMFFDYTVTLKGAPPKRTFLMIVSE